MTLNTSGPANNPAPNGGVTSDAQPFIQIRDLRVHFPIRTGPAWARRTEHIKAVDGVDLDIHRGEIFGLVGESGSGKSTLGRTLVQLQRATSGTITYNGSPITSYRGRNLKSLRQQLQVIFQDPYASLNPRMNVGDIIEEPLIVHRLEPNSRERRARVSEILNLVGLDSSVVTRYPHEFSGGQRQRIGIARALALKPEFIVADEPVSALDVSIQAQILNLMKRLQDELGLTYLFIGHDLAVVRHLSSRIAVMYLGHLMESAPKHAIYDTPLHPYTKALLAAVPVPDPEVEAKRQRIVLTGDIPSPQNPPAGCVFHTRCPIATEQCINEAPSYREAAPGHWVACHFA